jgi:hypothetical protein
VSARHVASRAHHEDIGAIVERFIEDNAAGRLIPREPGVEIVVNDDYWAFDDKGSVVQDDSGNAPSSTATLTSAAAERHQYLSRLHRQSRSPNDSFRWAARARSSAALAP